MSEGKWCHRGLLSVAIALVMALAGAFGLASTSVAEDRVIDPTKFLHNQKTDLTVTDIEEGVTGTAYKYMEVQWNTTEDEPTLPEYGFEDKVATWVKGKFSDYIKSDDNSPTDKFKNLKAGDMRTFTDKLIAAIVKGEVNLTMKDEEVFTSSKASDTSIKFHLPMGGYLIRLSNGPSHVYQPIATYVRPKRNTVANKYELEVWDVKGTPSDKNVEAKSMEITSTKTVRKNNSDTVNDNGRAAHGQIGDSFIFKVVTPIPRYPTEAVNKSFAVQDQPTPGLTPTTGSITVKIEGASGNEPLAESDYSMITLDAESGKRSQGFKVEFNEKQYKEKLANAGKEAKKLIIEYKGTLNNKAPVKGGAKNSAHPLIPKDFYKSDAGYATPNPTPAVTTIYTYGVKITKIGEAGKDSSMPPKLSGAKFNLYRGVQNGRRKGAEIHVEEQRATGDGAAAATGKYVVQASSGGGTTTTIISGKDGLLQIDGLGAGTYILEETKAPEGGYVLHGKSIAIVINDDDLNGVPDTAGSNVSTINGKPATVDNENRLTYDLMNKKADFRLPKTGAIGAVIFGVLGVGLIVTSVALVVAYRRKNKRSS